MKIRVMSVLAGLGGAMILSSESQGAYLGLGMRLHTTVSVTGAGGGLKHVWRLYAVFDHADDTVTAVGGSAANGPVSISTYIPFTFAPGGNFYNPGSGGNGAPVTSDGSFSPAQKQWDTYATIGGATDDINDPDDYSLSFTPGFPTFIQGNQLGPTNNAAWYVAGDSLQGAAGGGANGNVSGWFIYFGVPNGINGMGVMIAQFTVIAGQGVQGSLFVNGVLGGSLAGNTYTAVNQEFNTGFPTPGAVAVFVAGAVLGARRRRD